MRRTLTDDGADSEFEEQFRKMQRSAWRWEQQPVYAVSFELSNVQAFLAGHPEDPMGDPGLAYWYRQVAAQTAEGKTIARVKVMDEPPNGYQRWQTWAAQWNQRAGEIIDYITRSQADALPPSPFGAADWWVFDDERLMLMHFDEVGRRIKVELLINEPENELALRWRDKLVAAARSGRF